jgi:DNA mismatch repair protein MutS2
LLAERASLVAEEEREEAVVRARLTDALAAYLEALKANFSAVGVLDFRLARAVLADEWGAGKPSLLGEGDSATLENMSHPVIKEDLRKRDATFVRQSVSLPPGTTVLSGPNMGGKSVALKSTTLALVLIQLGYYPSATASATPLYDFISYSSNRRRSAPLELVRGRRHNGQRRRAPHWEYLQPLRWRIPSHRKDDLCMCNRPR